MKLSFRKKLIVPLFVSWFCLWAVTITALFHTKSLRLEERQFALKSANELALSITREYAGLADAGKMPADEAKAQAMARIKALRYGTEGYITIISSHPTVVMHPLKPELDGKDATDIRDPAGNYLFREMAAIAKSTGEGWVEYVWPKPGHPDQKEVFPKGSHVLTFKPWDWSFITGVYLDDLSDAMVDDFWEAFIALAIIGIALNGSIFLVIRSVERSVGGDPDHAAEVAHRITTGDLSVPVITRAGDSTSMLFAMKTMQDSLLSIVSRVRHGTDGIAIASQEIAAGNQDLSSRTEQQAASLEETASSIEELTGTVRQNADNAREANTLAMEASHVAGKGGEVVSEVVGTMAAINDSARKIVDIIGVIDSIAFQTNILALNAAVEAARAGEQGRGFAVVATEVRTLAQRSASAAKEIKGLIGDSVGKVQAGTVLVDQAGATMKEVVASVKKVSDLIADIAAAGQEQTAGIEQVNQAISQMDQVTQQNAALVEEAAAASDALQKQAADVAAAVSVFKLAHQSALPAAAPSMARKVTLPVARSAGLPAARSRTRAIAPERRVPPPVTTAADGWEEF